MLVQPTVDPDLDVSTFGLRGSGARSLVSPWTYLRVSPLLIEMVDD